MAGLSLFYFTANPWPDIADWRAIRDPEQRLERALDELYVVDSARDAVAPLHEYLEDAAEVLTSGRRARGRRRQLVTGALRHALAFSTWRSLSTNGIGRSDAAKLATALVEAAAGDRGDASASRGMGVDGF